MDYQHNQKHKHTNTIESNNLSHTQIQLSCLPNNITKLANINIIVAI